MVVRVPLCRYGCQERCMCARAIQHSLMCGCTSVGLPWVSNQLRGIHPGKGIEAFTNMDARKWPCGHAYLLVTGLSGERLSDTGCEADEDLLSPCYAWPTQNPESARLAAFNTNLLGRYHTQSRHHVTIRLLYMTWPDTNECVMKNEGL